MTLMSGALSANVLQVEFFFGHILVVTSTAHWCTGFSWSVGRSVDLLFWSYKEGKEKNGEFGRERN